LFKRACSAVQQCAPRNSTGNQRILRFSNSRNRMYIFSIHFRYNRLICVEVVVTALFMGPLTSVTAAGNS
jgi:hypothetical protein